MLINKQGYLSTRGPCSRRQAPRRQPELTQNCRKRLRLSSGGKGSLGVHPRAFQRQTSRRRRDPSEPWTTGKRPHATVFLSAPQVLVPLALPLTLRSPHPHRSGSISNVSSSGKVSQPQTSSCPRVWSLPTLCTLKYTLR